MESQMIKSIFCYRQELIKLTSIYTDDVDAGQKTERNGKAVFRVSNDEKSHNAEKKEEKCLFQSLSLFGMGMISKKKEKQFEIKKRTNYSISLIIED